MGIDIHALNFLRYARTKKKFGNTVTIGRQELHVNEVALKNLIKTKPSYKHQAYCEDLLLEYFDASTVDSIDNSSYEHATFIHNMNEPLPTSLYAQYDTVIDAGTTEHVYNAPQALENYSRLCRPGGQIIHILPANNFCGHGFWQFSPELFFSLYSSENGYQDTKVFVVDHADKKKWYQVIEPSNGKRVNILSSRELSVMARAVVGNGDISHATVQQSDYEFEWEHGKAYEPKPLSEGMAVKLKTAVEAAVMKTALYDALVPVYHKISRLRSLDKLASKNPGLNVVDINRFIAENRAA